MKPISEIVDEIDRLVDQAGRIYEQDEELDLTERLAGEYLNRARSLKWAIGDRRDVGIMLEDARVTARARNNS